MSEQTPQPAGQWLLDSAGFVQFVPQEEVRDKFLQGWLPASPDQVRDAKLQEKYDSPWEVTKAAGAGVARGLTLGLSDLALTKSGLASPETLAEQKEYAPIASGVGELAGAIAPAVLTGGAGAVAGGAAKTAGKSALRTALEVSPAGLATRAGVAVERGIAEGLGAEAASGFGRQLLARTAAEGAGSAVQGSFFGLGSTISEDALGDPNVVGPSAAAQIGLASLMGFGLGAAGGALGAALPRAIGAVDEAVGKKLTSLRDRVVEGMPRLNAVATGGANQPEVEFLWKNYRLATDKLGKTRLAQSTREYGDELIALDATVNRAADGAVKETVERTLNAQVPREAAVAEATRLANKLDAEILAAEALPGLRSSKTINAMRDISEDVRAKLSGEVGLAKPAAELYNGLQSVKRALSSLEQWNKAALDLAPFERDALKHVGAARSLIKDSLHDPAVWGDAGAKMAAVDEARSAAMAARDALLKNKDGYHLLIKGARGETDRINVQSLETWLSHMAEGKGQETGKLFQDYLDSMKNKVDVFKQHFTTGSMSDIDRVAFDSAVNKTGEMAEQIRKVGLATQYMKTLDSPGLFSGSGIGPFGIGYALGAPMGMGATAGSALAILHSVHHLATSAPAAIKALTAIEAAAQATSKAIKSLASTAVRGGVKAGRVTRGEAAAGIAKSFGWDTARALKAYAKSTEEINRLANEPDRLHDRLTQLTDGVGTHAPQVSQAIQITGARAVAFLSSKIQKPQKAGPLAPETQPSRAEIAKFNRYLEAVEDPVSVLKAVAAGTATKEGVEAVKAVYPEMADAMTQELLAAVVKNKNKVPYQVRRSMSLFLGQDLDGSGRAQVVASNQSVYNNPTANPGSKDENGKPRMAKRAKITLARRMGTAVSDVEDNQEA